jgi:hypothetical protein
MNTFLYVLEDLDTNKCKTFSVNAKSEEDADRIVLDTISPYVEFPEISDFNIVFENWSQLKYVGCTNEIINLSK